MSARPLIVVTHWVHEEALNLLRSSCDVIANSTREPWPKEVLQAHLAKADGVIAFMPDRFDADLLRYAPRLRILSCCLKGFDNFDIDACSKNNVLVAILPDLLTGPGAELAIGMMIAAGRHVCKADRYVRSGVHRGWRPHFYGTGLANSTVGLIGFGAVGQAIAERLRAFQSSVVYWDAQRAERDVEERLQARAVELDDLLRSADFIVLAVSLTPKTRHLIDSARLSLCKRHAILVNFARGSLVDEVAVAESLQKEHLGFYAADVFSFEDFALTDRPSEIYPPLLALTDKTLFTPHLGSAVKSVREEMAMESAAKILAFFDGKTPDGCLNADQVRPKIA